MVLLLQDGAVLRDVPESFALVALHITDGVPHHLHGNDAACDRLSVDRARTVVDVQSVYHDMCRMSYSKKSRLSQLRRFVPSRTRAEGLGE